MSRTLSKKQKRQRRHARIRARVFGSPERPRLSIFRSNKYLWAQLIDDEHGKTLCAASDREIKNRKKNTAKTIGEEIARKAKEAGISRGVFDRGGYKFHGKIKMLAEGAREAGLKI